MPSLRGKVLGFLVIFGITELFIYVQFEVKPKGRKTVDPYIINQVPRVTEEPASYVGERLSDEVTVVTAFFNIGPFLKYAVGKTRLMRSPMDYFRWSDIFGRMDNPLVAYTDSPQFYQRLRRSRSSFNSSRSKIYLIQKSDVWAFSLLHTVESIYNQTGYPKVLPTTTSASYTCVTHAKMELFLKTLQEKPFKTKYYSWVDVGVYREYWHIKKMFHVGIPSDFNSSRIFFNQVAKFDNVSRVADLIRYCFWFVGAGIFLGEVQPLTLFMRDYTKMVRMLINRFMIGAEEQVFYAMYRNFLGFKPRVDIQLYDRRNDSSRNFWFALATHLRKLGYYKQPI